MGLTKDQQAALERCLDGENVWAVRHAYCAYGPGGTADRRIHVPQGVQDPA